jgi:hypothetical protein
VACTVWPASPSKVANQIPSLLRCTQEHLSRLLPAEPTLLCLECIPSKNQPTSQRSIPLSRQRTIRKVQTTSTEILASGSAFPVRISLCRGHRVSTSILRTYLMPVLRQVADHRLFQALLLWTTGQAGRLPKRRLISTTVSEAPRRFPWTSSLIRICSVFRFQEAQDSLLAFQECGASWAIQRLHYQRPIFFSKHLAIGFFSELRAGWTLLLCDQVLQAGRTCFAICRWCILSQEASFLCPISTKVLCLRIERGIFPACEEARICRPSTAVYSPQTSLQSFLLVSFRTTAFCRSSGLPAICLSRLLEIARTKRSKRSMQRSWCFEASALWTLQVRTCAVRSKGTKLQASQRFCCVFLNVCFATELPAQADFLPVWIRAQATVLAERATRERFLHSFSEGLPELLSSRFQERFWLRSQDFLLLRATPVLLRSKGRWLLQVSLHQFCWLPRWTSQARAFFLFAESHPEVQNTRSVLSNSSWTGLWCIWTPGLLFRSNFPPWAVFSSS